MKLKRKCRFCKEYTREYITVPAGSFCNMTHAISFTNEKRAKDSIKLIAKKVKEEKKAHSKKKREFYDKDIKTRKKAAKDACHAFIRARDRGKPCICCDRPWDESIQAGHFQPSGSNPLIRYDESNINGQLLHCNYYKGGDSGDYEKNLRVKVGDEKVDELLSKTGGVVKWTADMYKEIEVYYKRKLKELEGE